MIESLNSFAQQLKEASKANKKMFQNSFKEFGQIESMLKQNEHLLTDEQKSNMNKAKDIIAKAKKDYKENLK